MRQPVSHYAENATASATADYGLVGERARRGSRSRRDRRLPAILLTSR